MERKIFEELLELKRMQIRAGRANEQVLVKRLSGVECTFCIFPHYFLLGSRKGGPRGQFFTYLPPPQYLIACNPLDFVLVKS